MNTIKNDKVITEFGFTKPAIYQIEVLGEITEYSSGYFGEMEINIIHKPGQKPISTLTGMVKDQSALLGILNALNNMHFPILSIEVLENDQN